MRATGFLSLLVLFGCNTDGNADKGASEDSTVPTEDTGDTSVDSANPLDADGDGSLVGEDCDDGNPDAFPGNQEIWYDGIDNDCDGRSDYDQDRDGYDSDAFGGADCDDTDKNASPGTPENGQNGIDDDCDGQIDEPLTSTDVDGDGVT